MTTASGGNCLRVSASDFREIDATVNGNAAGLRKIPVGPVQARPPVETIRSSTVRNDGGERLQCGPRIGPDRCSGRPAFQDRGVGMDMDQRLVVPDHRKVAGRDAVQTRTGRDDKIRLLPALLLEAVAVDLQMTDIGRLVIGDRILAPVGGGYGRAAGCSESGKRGFRPLERDQFSRDDDRAAGGIDQPRRPGNGFGVRQYRSARDRLRHGRRACVAVRNVLGHDQYDRPRPPRHGEFERAGRLVRHLRRRFRLEHCLRDAGKHLVVVDFLERLPSLGGGRHIADHQQHWHRILSGDMQTDGRIGRTGPAADEADRRLAGNSAIGRAGKGNARFMAGRDEADGIRPALQPREDREVAFSRNRKGRIHVPCCKRLRQRLPAVHQQCPSACSWLSGSSRRCRCTT